MKEKIKYVIIVLLIITLSVIVSLITNLIVKDNNKDLKCDDTKIQENTDDTNLDLIYRLYDSLVTADHENSAHYNEKVTVEDTKHIDFIKYNIKKYILERNDDYGQYYETYADEDQPEEEIDYSEHGGIEVYRLSKKDFNEYMSDNYKTSLKYNYKKNEYVNFHGTLVLGSYEDDWVIEYIATGGGSDYIDHKFLSYEVDKDNIYIYDKFVDCQSEAGIKICTNKLTDYINEGIVIDCTVDENDEVNPKTCPIDSGIKELAEYALENMSDKLNTYKHTFKKIDGKYYWYSSEIVK